MNANLRHVIKAVIRSLENEVLPHLDASTTPASNVRACLMMLTSVEDRIVSEQTAIFEDNQSLRSLLREALSKSKALDLDEPILARVSGTIEGYVDRFEMYDAAAASRENHSYKSVLTELIRHLGDKRSNGVNEANRDFRVLLHCYLNELNQREISLVERALTKVPV